MSRRPECRPINPHLPLTTSSDSDDATSGSRNGSPASHEKPSEEQELAKLAELFPTVTPEQLKFVYFCLSRTSLTLQ